MMPLPPAACVHVRDPFQPWRGAEARPVRRRARLRALAPAGNDPRICLLNGHPLPRAAWGRRVRRGDVAVFVLLPRGGGGGGGSNPMRVVLSLALMAFAGPAAGWLNTSMSLGLGEFGLAALKFGINVIGGALINAALPVKTPAPQQLAAIAAPSPTYNIQAQGNYARLGQPIPDHFGRHIVWPDFIAEPYAEYAGNEQYVYQLLAIGQGEYDIEAIRIEDTAMASFPEVETEIVGPGGTVTLFPANVINSAEVSGQELLTAAPIGPFAANAAGTLANKLGIDLVCPSGLYFAADDGSLTGKTVTVQIEARSIDAAGAPLSSWATLGTESITASTTTAQRRSFRYSVTPARYEVRCTRTDTKDTAARAGHTVLWGGLRAYLPGTQQYGDITVLAVRARASNSLSATSSRRFNLTATRKLPIWNGSAWSAPTATRSIAWAFAHVCRARYAGNLPDSRVPLAELLALDAVWDARGDTFDGRFDTAQTVWDALEQIAQAGRAKRWMQGGVVRIARDAAATLPVAMFSPYNITRGSYEIEYLMPTEEMADSVEVTYFDEDYWIERTVVATLPGSTADNPAKIRLFGVTQRAQAWREGMYHAACNRWRRKLISHGTELEGHIPGPLDLVAESHDLPRWGQSAEAVAWDDGTRTLTVSEPFEWAASGTHYLQFRRRDGSPAGPFPVTSGSSDYDLVLTDWNAETDPTPDTGDERERAHVSFGLGENFRQLCRLVGARPQGRRGVELHLVNEDDRVHTADEGDMPADTYAYGLPSLATRPTLSGLRVLIAGSALNPVLNASWQPVPGVTSYVIEQAPAGTTSWSPVATTFIPGHSWTPPARGYQVRVAAIGKAQGDWATATPIEAASYLADTADLADEAITTYGITTGNGYARYFTAGTVGVLDGSDVFGSVTYVPQAGDVVTVEAFFRFKTDYSSNALDNITLTPNITLSGDATDVAALGAKLWRQYDTADYVTYSIALSYVAGGAACTAALRIDFESPGGFTNSALAQYRVAACVVRAFTARK